METIGKYQVQRVLGRGGMGTVYEALDPVIHRKVAVKTMIPGLAESPDLRLRFLREAQAAGGLRHRNIVTVYDLGEDRGRPYIAMEFIEGTDLERIIENREPRSVEWKLEILRQICDGLGYAHRSGIVHRDIKPANIRVTPDGEVKIMDFGIAHLQSSSLTRSGLVMGTVHYMAPEQIEGHKVDHRADIFSVGAISYELLAYRKPFEGESITGVMYKIIHQRPDPASFPRTQYAPGLDAIVMKALACDVSERYQSLDLMEADLQDLIQDANLRGSRSGTTAVEEDSARRLEQDMTDMRAEMARARAEGRLQKALGLCRRLLELSPEDEAAARSAAEIQAAIQEKEVEQLCGLALSYAAEGDEELTQKIALKVGKINPHSPRYLELKAYLEEEASRRLAETRTAAAQEHLANGDLEEACAAAEEALAAYPAHALAREIRDRSAVIVEARKKAAAHAQPSKEATAAPAPPLPPPLELQAETTAAAGPSPGQERQVTTAPAPTPAPASVAAPAEATSGDITAEPMAVSGPNDLTPLPEAPPANPDAASLLDTARRLLKERTPQKAFAALEQAVALEPEHPVIQRLLEQARGEARRAEAAALTTAALNHFVQSNHGKALKAVEKALTLEPENRKARELLKILGTLG